MCFSVNFFLSIFRLLKVILLYSTANLGLVLLLERACRLIVTPEKGVQDFWKRRLTYAKPKWTRFLQEKKRYD